MKTGPQRYETYYVVYSWFHLCLMERISERRNHAFLLNPSLVLKTVSLKIGIPGWKLVNDMKNTELLKVL